MTLVLRYAARSDRGLVRANNEDSVYAGARLLALAYGMGGHAAGEVASQLVIAALAHLDDDETGGDLLGKLDAAVRAGNSAIAAQVEMEPDLEGMGTTLTAILFAGNWLGLVHIGDSRGYLLRDGELTQITKDDIRRNCNNLAERLGFLGRVIHGANPKAWLKEVRQRVGEGIDFAVTAE